MIQALQRAGVDVTPVLTKDADDDEADRAPEWMKAQLKAGRNSVNFNNLTISCVPPYFLERFPGQHWLLSMTEGSEMPDHWADSINKSGVQRVIVPCEHNAKAFREGGVKVPAHVVPGGTCPDEFPLLDGSRPDRPYTFLALGDRGARKGWTEVYTAFLRAFKTQTDVRLIIKCRPQGNELLELMARSKDLDPRITILVADMDMRELYASVDCFAIPSRCEGWGMPHREAAMMGLPVITQVHSGLDDGHTHEWAIPLTKGHLEAIPSRMGHIKGEWTGADVDELVDAMRWCYTNPDLASDRGSMAAGWLRANQTWQHAAQKLLDLIQVNQ